MQIVVAANVRGAAESPAGEEEKRIRSGYNSGDSETSDPFSTVDRAGMRSGGDDREYFQCSKATF